MTAADAVRAAREAIMRELCPDPDAYPYVPYALWLDYEAAVAERDAEGLRELAAAMRKPASLPPEERV
jgi:hypothetical protein